MSRFTYPHTKRVDVVDELFGHKVVDSYRWLEQDARTDPKVTEWVEAQRSLTSNYLATLPCRDIFRHHLKKLYDQEGYTAPQKCGERYFFTMSLGLDSQPSLYVREGVFGAERILIDPNTWSYDGADALAEWAVSDDGAFVAYGVQQGGTDWRTIRVLNVETGGVLEEAVNWVRFTQIIWKKDASGFIYSRFPEPEGGANSAASIADHAIYFHALGTPQSSDLLIHATPNNPGCLHLADRTDDGTYLLIYSTLGVGTNALAVVDLASEDWIPRILIANYEAEWSVIGSQGTRLFIMTSQDAERRKIVALDIADAELTIDLVVPEDEAVLNNASILGGYLLTTYFRDAYTQMRRFKLDGTADGSVQLPGIGSAGGFKGKSDDNEAFYLFTSFDTPVTVYRYDVDSNTSTVWAQPTSQVDREMIIVKQYFFTSRDGTKVPLFTVRRKGDNGPSPTLLYGYGGFGISSVPIYSPAQMAWIEQGGILAVANIRGGGEYGKAWHRAGQMENKQNVFDDFIAASEFLKEEGITPENGLVVQGESNGGLLIGVVVNQRPDLYAVALPGVGVMDMLRYHLFTGGQLWITEFGSPEEEKHFNNLLSYSPYHNVQEGKSYPAILATTADTDNRVVPGHTFKYIAAIQVGDTGSRPHLVRVETRAGHGAGMPKEKIIEQIADQWAFAAHWSSLKVVSSQ
ncbi:MAG: prolyl oligopeptidase family serine peptidase [Halomonas sp.]|uniref:prolyl oligopeptidase family serine peptidase n=1 Tax=Halomonas sp. TaxID=1486246 RepID=UPI003F91B0E3